MVSLLLRLSSCRTVDSKTLLLIDSGGQYDCGTTDITRTMHFGSPTEHQRRCYTRVLQGHIALSQVSFILAAGVSACMRINVAISLQCWLLFLDQQTGITPGPAKSLVALAIDL
jgi:Xaa-Pro aminopeptidase